MGTCVTGVGDSDGDGHDDIAIGVPGDHTTMPGGDRLGSIWVYMMATESAFLGPEAEGSMGVGLGGPWPLLRVNGSAGGIHHRVDVDPLAPITISFDTPPTAPQGTVFALWARFGIPEPTDAVVLPLDAGTMCFAPPGDLTVTSPLGADFAPWVVAPWNLATPPLGVSMTFTLQGIGAETATVLRATNAVILNVE